MKGFRQPTENSKKEQLRELKTELANMQMAGRISQMMIQQMMNNNKSVVEDLGRALGLINELQYKLLAIQQVSNLNVDDLSKVADELRLKDFNEASDNEDAKEGFTTADTVSADSTVIITSATTDGKGIFRSRIQLSSCGVPALITELTGKSVGETVTVALNGTDHQVTLLGVRNPKAAELPIGTITTAVAADTAQQPTVQ